jgi:hypothetical protein
MPVAPPTALARGSGASARGGGLPWQGEGASTGRRISSRPMRRKQMTILAASTLSADRVRWSLLAASLASCEHVEECATQKPDRNGSTDDGSDALHVYSRGEPVNGDKNGQPRHTTCGPVERLPNACGHRSPVDGIIAPRRRDREARSDRRM